MAPEYRALDWYETPLYYDIVFDTDTASECDFLEAVYARHAPTRKRRVLEPACGSGRLVAELGRRGYRVLGFDRSDGALAFARRRLAAARAGRELHARVMKAGMEAFRSRRRFDLAHCLVSSFKYLLTEDHARAHLQCMADVLAPGGVYVIGFHLSDYGKRSPGRERWVAERDGVKVVCNIQTGPADRRTRRERMRSRLVVDMQGESRRYETVWEFRTYDARQFRSLLAQVPALVHVATYDFDYDLRTPRQLGRERLDQVVILQRR